MLGEHILYSIAVAIIVGTFFERKYGYSLPIWIIIACAWAPDIDYVIQSISFTLANGQWYLMEHGDFHNFIVMIVFSYIAAVIFEKYWNYNFRDVFLCVNIGFLTHLICDYIVYSGYYSPFTRIFPSLKIHAINIFPELGSWYGLGEKYIFIMGFALILFAMVINFYFSESKWISDNSNKIQQNEV